MLQLVFVGRPKRILGISYTGCALYFVTTNTLHRRKAFLDHDFAAKCRDALSATSEEFGYTSIVFTFMPDHVHILTEGEDGSRPLPEFVAMWKQRTGWLWRKQSGSRLWQPGYWERVLRADEPMLSVARYIIENPVRAGLVKHAQEYPLTGSDAYALDDILAAYQMDPKLPWKP